jgi:L-asparaginase
MTSSKLSEIDGERFVLHRWPLLRTTIIPPWIEPAVDLIKRAIVAISRLLRGSLSSGALGIVIEAFSRSNALLVAIAGVREAMVAGLLVVITSRCPQGQVQPIYDQSGGHDPADADATFADDLIGLKARIQLIVLRDADLASRAIEVRFAAVAE